MNGTIDLLKNHRSIRKFSSQAVDDATLEELILAGQSASTSSFIQAYSIIDITDPEIREALAALAGHQAYITQASRFLVCCGDMRRLARCAEAFDIEPDTGYIEQLLTCSIDVALMAQNMAVAAESIGLGCVYIGAIRNNPDEVTRLLKLPSQVIPLFGLCIGHPEQDPQKKPRLPSSVILHKNSYNDQQLEKQLLHYDSHIAAYYRERTGGKVSSGWSEQMAKKMSRETRPTLLKYLQGQGFALR